MLYFIIQTILLSLCVFITGLFIGIFIKNLWCKNKLIKQKTERIIYNKNRENKYIVQRDQSAAMAKKRTMALVSGRRRVDMAS